MSSSSTHRKEDPLLRGAPNAAPPSHAPPPPRPRPSVVPIARLLKLFSLLKWTLLVVIAVATALVGFAQSMLVASLYRVRSNIVYGIVSEPAAWVPKLFQYLGFNLGLAGAASLAVFLVSPPAAGSGIPDVVAYLNGAEGVGGIDRFFSVRTFAAKVVGSALAVASSLAMGKEGPMLHAGSILAVIVGRSRWFLASSERAGLDAGWGAYAHATATRELVAAGAAAGVATAFRAPVGGVLFSMEMSTRWRKELTWRCFLVSAVAIVVVRALVGACVARGRCSYLQWGSLAWFSQAYPSPYGQVWALALLAVAGGYVGSFFTSFNTWWCLVRRRWARWAGLRVLEVCALSVLTSLTFFALPLAGECRPCTYPEAAGSAASSSVGSSSGSNGSSGDAAHCLAGEKLRTFSGYGCGEGTYNDLAALVFNPQGFVIQTLFTAPPGALSLRALLVYGGAYYALAALTYGAFIPSGLFTVGLIFGGAFGRAAAEVLLRARLVDGAVPGLVGLYALLGAASFLGGLMRMSASLALILMEMTGAPGTLPLLMAALVIAKGVGDQFNYSVFDHQIALKGLPLVGGLPDHAVAAAGLEAGNVMTRVARLNGGGGGDEDGGEGGGDGKGPTSAAAAPPISAAAKGTALAPPLPELRVVESGAALADALDAARGAAAFPVAAAPRAPGERGDFLGIVARTRCACAAVFGFAELPAKSHSPSLIITPTLTLPMTKKRLRDLLARHGEAAAAIDLSSHIQPPPVTAPPGLPLPAVYQLMRGHGVEFLPVVARYGPLEGAVTRAGIAAVQAARLDRFHVRQAMAQAAEDLAAGRVLASMALDKQAAALRDAVAAPLRRAASILLRGDDDGDAGGGGEGANSSSIRAQQQDESERAPMLARGHGGSDAPQQQRQQV